MKAAENGTNTAGAESRPILRVISAVLAVLAAAVLFVTYGTALPSAPFAEIGIDGPVNVDSDGELTVVVDGGSRRALILNGSNDLTGVVDCTTVDSPIEAITDVCVADGTIFLSGVMFAPDSEDIELERIVAYDKGGNLRGTRYELSDAKLSIPAIKGLSADDGGVVAAREQYDGSDTVLIFTHVEEDAVVDVDSGFRTRDAIHDVAFTGRDDAAFVALSALGLLDDGGRGYANRVYDGHVFTAVDIDDRGTLYACDDETGDLFAIRADGGEAVQLIGGDGYDSVRENGGLLSLCDTDSSHVILANSDGAKTSEFSSVRPSIGYTARMVLVWACAAYLVALAVVLAIRKTRRLVKEGRTESFGPMLLSVAVVAAIAVAVGSLSNASYQSSLDMRANVINMCADYLEQYAPNLSQSMEKADDRNALRGSGDEYTSAVEGLLEAADPAFSLAGAAANNDIGLYVTLYGKDEKGVFYLFGSSFEYIMGTSAKASAVQGLDEVFASSSPGEGELLSGRTLRDATQYRLVPIPSTDGESVAGVIEIGSRMSSFDTLETGIQARRILALLVMVLVIYLAYSEVRACARCLFEYRTRQQEPSAQDERGNASSIALLTRPFTLAITMLSSIDSVMTVLIARDLLEQAGAGASSPLIGVPAVMLGVGLVVGQMLYGFVGSRVGLRRLMASGAVAALAFAVMAGVAVASGSFAFYCGAKFALSVPFGLLYTMGYSMPRLADDEATRAEAAGGVKRTDTSAAALGTVLGGYAAQVLGNAWVYALVAVACLAVAVMAFNMLPKGLRPLEQLAQVEGGKGRATAFAKTPSALALALLVVLPATVAAGYASFLFPLFSIDFGLTKSDINNIVVLGQLVVYVCIDSIERVEQRQGKWRSTRAAIALLGVVFLLFSVNTTIVWSTAVIALVGLLGKTSDGWKGLWLKAAAEADVPAGRATGAMFATRSLALIVQPFIMTALLGASDSFAVIVIGVFCLACALLFSVASRRSSLAG